MKDDIICSRPDCKKKEWKLFEGLFIKAACNKIFDAILNHLIWKICDNV